MSRYSGEFTYLRLSSTYIINFKKGAVHFFSQITDQPSSKKAILLRFLPNDVYLDEI